MTIHGRIICGYALSLGVALGGTLTGILIGRHYQQQALANLQAATRDYKLLSSLQVDILYNRPTKQLSPYLAHPKAFETASNQLLDRLAAISANLSTYNMEENEAATLNGLQPLLQNYEGVVRAFVRVTQEFIQEVETQRDQPDFQITAERQLLRLVQSPEFVNFIDFPGQLEPFYRQSEEQGTAAARDFAQAEALQSQITIISCLISLAIALLLALYVSRKIARPIQTLTQVARQVTQEANFDLQAPVETQDEVGVLADSINQLIHQVKQLLDQQQVQNTDLELALEQLSQQQMHLIQTEKMSSLGQLVAGVAHEINNPVNFIHGNLQPLRQYTDDLLNLLALYQIHYPQPDPEIVAEVEAIDLEFLRPDLHKLLDSMTLGTGRIRQIVLSLRNFSRMDEAEFKSVDIHEGIDSTLLILQHRLQPQPQIPRPAIQVYRDYGDLPVVDCYPSQLNQVLINILANAIDALEEAAKSDQSADLMAASAPTITIRTRLVDQDWIEIAIVNNGPPIAETVRQRIFEPFFTTKPVGQGTGLGMSISYQIIVDKHSGHLFCEATAQGTEFRLQIPRQQQTKVTAVPVAAGVS